MCASGRARRIRGNQSEAVGQKVATTRSTSGNATPSDSAVGKTFLLLDLALHIASGRPWNGRAVDKGRVLYIAAEGAVVVIASSDDTELCDTCDRVLVMRNGGVVAEVEGDRLTPEELKNLLAFLTRQAVPQPVAPPQRGGGAPVG